MRRAGLRKLRPSPESLEGRRLLDAGDLDPSFGTGGTGAVSFRNDIQGESLTDLTSSGDSIIAAGRFGAGGGPSSTYSVLRRFTRDGIPGANIDIPVELLFVNSVDARDGKIVVAGSAPTEAIRVVRLDANGSMDASFGSGGTRTVSVWDDSLSSTEIAEDVAIQPDGKVVVVGRVTLNDGSITSFVLRLDRNGVPDPSFGQGGLTFIDFAGSSVVWARAVALRGDNVVVAGVTHGRPNAPGDDFFVTMLTSTGQPRPGFGTDGTVFTDFNDNVDIANAAAVQPDGKIVVAGQSGSDFAAACYLDDGRLDPDFGTGGRAIVDFGGLDMGEALALQPDGKIVVAGTAQLADTGFALARLLPSGAPDPGFGAGGKVVTTANSFVPAFPAPYHGQAVVLQSDGKIVVGGSSGNDPNADSDVALARYQGVPGTPTPPSSPSLHAVSDTGPVGDNITSSRSPVFNVSGVPAGVTLALLRDGVVVNTLANVDVGTVAIGDPGPLLAGRYAYTAIVIDGTGNVSPSSAPTIVSIVSVRGDYNGDGKADFSVFRRAGTGALEWYVAGIAPPGAPSFGAATLDVPLQGDLDGDGRTDLILYRPSTSQWFVQQSSKGFVQYQFGGPGDLPATGEFDGLGYSQLAVYRPSTGQWFVGGHAGVYTQFGGPQDIPVPLRNYYGAGRDVLAVYRPGAGQWFVAGQAGGVSFGGPDDLAMPQFNVHGDGRDELGVFRPSTAEWYVGGRADGIRFGGPGDIAVAADFDGIGRDQQGVYRPSTGEWFVGGHAGAVASFGGSSDIPVASPFPYRTLSGVKSSGTPDLGSTAPETSVGAKSTFASTSTTSTTTVSPITPTSTRDGRPKQAVESPRFHLHDVALASLQGFRKRGRGSLLLGG